MKVKFRTETGSIYVVDDVLMTWFRENKTDASGEIRGEAGPLSFVPVVKVGERAVFLCPAYVPGSDGRVIETSPVVEIIK